MGGTGTQDQTASNHILLIFEAYPSPSSPFPLPLLPAYLPTYVPTYHLLPTSYSYYASSSSYYYDCYYYYYDDDYYYYHYS